ncbi:MAG: bifunctional oligoribonuclease/PAP phosphatase NrnA [Dysgonamonadaceae bacterium]|jgi:phosphoesterase RecJ-like protein|nr:bifunctional oligoribonuclease/PAP phosphatase NrnA [Dysgonamonadaceae bacterium]
MITKIIDEAEIQKAKKYIGYVEQIVIVTHISPDGDAIGSSLALYHFLLEMDKQVNVIVPNEFPEFLRWMKGANDIIIHEKNPQIAEETIAAAELIFCLDFNVLKRIEKLGPLVTQSKAKKVMIDHHLSPEIFCNVTMSYPQISSTSEMIFRLICRMGFFEDINKKCAECIYTGMMTDTGAFTYNSNNSEIYYIIGELIKKGINKDKIYALVYNTSSIDRLRLQGYVMYEKMKIFPEYKTSLITLSQKELDKFNFKKGDTEGFVNIPLVSDEIVFSALIKEDKGFVKISLRSKGDFPCNQFATERFNGGGHLNAAGGEYFGSFDNAIKHFEKVLPEYQKLLLKN